MDTQDGTTGNGVDIWRVKHVVVLLKRSSTAQERLVFICDHWPGGSRHSASVRRASVSKTTLERLLFGRDFGFALLQKLRFSEQGQLTKTSEDDIPP